MLRSTSLSPSVLTVLGDKPDGASRPVFAVEFGIPAMCAGFTVVLLIFRAYQGGGLVRVIDASFHKCCFRYVSCDIDGLVYVTVNV
ncbi:hypothetical protein DESC_600039 [Desulfosarcina cetonica]|nr:hypothetical protein DESC_600039 [Desulfosarcina cetonica]